MLPLFPFGAWHWLALGLLLITAEVFVPSFFLLWFGISAMVIAFIIAFTPLHWAVAVLIWLVLAGALAWLYFKVYPKHGRSRAGLGGKSVVGQTGMVIGAFDGQHAGLVRFNIPLLGASEWAFKSFDGTPIESGARVAIIDIIGNEMICMRK